MKKYFYVLAALSIAPTYSLAQSLEGDVDAELDQMYSSAEAAPAAHAPSAKISNTAPVSGQPIYILNQATPTSNAQLQQQQIQKQPTTVIEASPLTESRAEQIRRSRQDAELQTEQRIVEKLETSRMEDEKKRASVLFGDKFNQLNSNEVQSQNVQQTVVAQPVQVQHVEEPKENTRDIIREELAAAMKDEEAVALTPIETKYVGAVLGVGDYPDVRNVRGNYALGVSFGSKFDNFVLEGSFLYSNYTVENHGPYNSYGQGYNCSNGCGYPYGGNGGIYIPNNIDVNQYTGSLAAKVQLFDGIVKPVIGGLVAYSYRNFAWSNDNHGYGYQNNTTANSHAIDFGALVGADLEFSPKYSLGVDLRYMWNLSSRVNGGNSWMSGPQYGTPIEKLQYYLVSLVGRVNF